MRIVTIVLSLFFLSPSVLATEFSAVKSLSVKSETVTIESLLERVNHYGNGVMKRTFRGQGRCSQVCPIMHDIGSGHCKSIGRCWCDERGGGVTIAYLVCR